ncbi:hypothetical protein EOD41_13690 [Mucilaginibacter limnophilus]|uniref:Carboxypeptidase regulatory-like domain-containing protein n=1 Tax=Mucilaginibacter limnophilus TaxID=1932778 RepID=A0A437MQW5_9SPHI|nr:hypothetical protein [Mucilaginibacter limnophilus]RVU00013.1 hypothetical protein EOD41_13690 [Mucilaginibacter limnophilus]
MRALLFRICLLLTFLPFNSNAQQAVNIAAAKQLITNVDTFMRRMPLEKVFTHTDRPYYSNTDTIWLKNYVLDGLLEYSKQSGIVYAELVNDTGRVVMQQAMPVFTGINWGQMVLDSTIVSEGNYTLRTYTNWMQNLGPESFYQQRLYISSTDESNRRVNVGIRAVKDSVETRLQILEADGSPLRLQDMQVSLTEGRKTWFRERRQTDLEGKVNLEFILSNNSDAGKLTLIARDRNKKGGARQLVIPLHIDRPAYTDVQFMPEGGQLVAGLTSIVGFKAVSESGRGVNIKGVIRDSRKQSVAKFSSTHNGMGSFQFTPLRGESYSAFISLSDGSTKQYEFPQFKQEGMVINVKNNYADSALTLTIQASAGLPEHGAYALVAESGGIMCYGSVLRFRDSVAFVRTRISKTIFPTGVVRFTLLTIKGRPVAERMVFIDHDDRINISMIANDKTRTADSVCLSVKATDKYGMPVQGSFSIAVTDDSQVKMENNIMPDIHSRMYLTSAIKGYVEQPGWYFSGKGEAFNNAIDNLLLTQGWTGYNWDDVFNTKFKPAYNAERSVAVSGRVVRLNKPQANIPVVLISTKKPIVVRDTISDKFGKFTFTDLPPFDTAAFVVEAKDKKGKIFAVNVELDKFIPPAATAFTGALIDPWYVNSDSTMLSYHQKNIQYQKQLNDMRYPGSGKMLQEVVIKAKKVVKNSHNLNGNGEADQLVDEAEIIKAGDISLIDLLYKKIKGFTQYRLHGRALKFVIDGVELDFLYDPEVQRDYYQFLTFNLNALRASDVKGLELLENPRYSSKYVGSYDPEILIASSSMDWPAYIEITTWSGNGLFSRNNPSLSIIRPVPVSWPKQYYVPKYTPEPGTLTELRPTVYWKPDVVTDANGNAEIVFYTKKKRTNYTIVMQGANLNGLVGTSAIKLAAQ